MYKNLKKIPTDTIEYINSKINLTTYNRILKKSIREAKLKFYESKFEKCKSNSKQTWEVINDVMNKKDKNIMPDYMIINDSHITDKTIIAEHFNNYFNEIGTNMAANIQHHPNMSFEHYLNNNYTSEFMFTSVSENDVSNIIEELHTKCSTGYDGISTKLLKLIKQPILQPLTTIVNQSLTSGIFPDKLKIAKITPIYKKDNKHHITNYRPISILPAISKIFEKIVCNQISSYLIKNNYLTENQYGFCKLFSTEHAILELSDRVISELDQGHSPLAIFLDLSKAFDTLNHDILLSKLQYYGIKNSAFNWLKTYLENRNHFVQIENYKSRMLPVSLGVPQGTILGPLLFIIYINDISHCSDFFKFITYADDTNLFYNMHNTDPTNINSELNKVLHWLEVNKLSINIPKTKFMIFHNQNKNINCITPDITIKDTKIERVESFNFLGVIFDQHMKWNCHVNNIALKLSRTIGIFYKLKHFLPSYILKMLYNSLILPHLSYGILAWGTSSEHLFKLQKKSVRIIANEKYNAHTEPLFKSLDLLKLNDIFKSHILKFYFNFCHNLLPEFFLRFDLVQRSNFYAYNIRTKNVLHTSRTYSKIGEKALRYILPRVINDTSLDILDKIYTHSIKGYISYIKLYFLNNYVNDCKIQNCYICNR